jgi:hypothetical protein
VANHSPQNKVWSKVANHSPQNKVWSGDFHVLSNRFKHLHRGHYTHVESSCLGLLPDYLALTWFRCSQHHHSTLTSWISAGKTYSKYSQSVPPENWISGEGRKYAI